MSGSGGLISFISRSRKSFISSIWTPPSGTAQINGDVAVTGDQTIAGDLDVTGSIKDVKTDTEVGFAGAVGVIDGVEDSLLKNTLFGSPFRNDILKGAATFTGVSGDIYLYRINTAGTITYEMFTSSTTGANTPTANTESVFDMTKLGVYNADQVLAMASLGVTVTVATRIDALSTVDANTVMPILQPSHVSGLQPSKVIKVVNRGNNLALLPSSPFASSSATVTYVLSADGIIIGNTNGAQANEFIYIKYQLIPNTVYVFSREFEAIVGASADIGGCAVYDGTVATLLVNVPYTTASGSFTTDDTGLISVLFRAQGGTPESTSIRCFNIQLNQGSTALPYSTPRNSPFLMGSESVNQSDANEYDDTDEVTFTALADGPYMLASDATGTWATGAIVTAITDLVAGESKTWTGLGTHAGLEHMVLAGEYTQAEVRALGFVAYKPVLLLNSGDGADNVSDYLAQVGSDVFKYPQVETVDGFEYGDDEIDSTELVVNGDAWTGATGATPPTSWIRGGGSTATFTIVDDLAGGAPDNANLKIAHNGANDNPWFTQTLTTVIGKEYSFSTWYKNIDASSGVNIIIGTSSGGSQLVNLASQALTVWTKISDTFIAEGTSTYLAWQLVSTTSGQYAYIDEFSINAYNIWQNTSQSPINMTENGLALTALDQPAVKGQNHEIVEGGGIVVVEHSIGISAAFASQSRVSETKADKSEVPHIRPLKITSTSIIGAAVDTVIQFSDIADYPDFFSNPVYTEATKDANVASFVVFPNAVVITTDGTGTGAGDTLLLIDISEAEALVSHTLA